MVLTAPLLRFTPHHVNNFNYHAINKITTFLEAKPRLLPKLFVDGLHSGRRRELELAVADLNVFLDLRKAIVRSRSVHFFDLDPVNPVVWADFEQNLVNPVRHGPRHASQDQVPWN